MSKSIIDAYPLSWPDGRERTAWPQVSSFGDISFSRARDELIAEVLRLQGRRVRAYDPVYHRDIILSTNVELRKDGIPYSARRAPQDKGVAIYFDYEDEQMVFACDRWRSVAENMWAIKKTIEALRGVNRWGSGDMLKRAFRGFKALPESGSINNLDAFRVLGLEPGETVSQESLHRAYKSKMMQHHPDVGGDPQKAAEISAAYQKLKGDI